MIVEGDRNALTSPSGWPDITAARALLERVGRQDPEAIRELWSRVSARVLAFARRRLRDDRDAEEVSNDTMMEILMHPDRYRGEARFSTYVLGVAHNKINYRLRQVARTPTWEVLEEDWDAPAQEPTPIETLELAQQRSAVERCLQKLRDPLRTALYLAYVEELSREEIGKLLGCTGNLIRQRVHQALKAIEPCIASIDKS
jgi:RNA polymerase sigma-70 factor, ECF subfamily